MYCNQHTSDNRVSVVCLTNVHILVLSCVRSELMEMTKCAAYGTHQPKEWVLYKCPCVCVLYNSVKSEFMKMTECAAYSTHQPKQSVLYKCSSVCVFYTILLYRSDHELMKMTECAAYGTHQPKEWVLYIFPSVCVLYNSLTYYEWADEDEQMCCLRYTYTSINKVSVVCV